MLALFCEHFAHAFSYPTSGVLFPNHVLFTIRLSLPPVFYFVLAVLQLFLNFVPVQTPVFVHWREDLTRCVFPLLGVAQNFDSLVALCGGLFEPFGSFLGPLKTTSKRIFLLLKAL